MDKRIVFSVAGSGKTSSIIDKIEKDSRCLVITYTENNTRNIRNGVIQKLGEIPEGVRIYSYFTFLYSFCFRPICGYELKAKGINFDQIPKYAQRTPKSSLRHCLDKNDRIFAGRMAKLMIECDVVPEVIERLEKFFDLVCIDESQDLAANDFNFLCALGKSDVQMYLVGDFYQHTFDTSRDGNIQKNLHSSFRNYCRQLSGAGFDIDMKSLSHSYRCSPSVCDFVSNKLGIEIYSHRDDEVEVSLVENNKEVEDIYFNNDIVKLFYQKSSSYEGYSENWGSAKGVDDFYDVCVVLNNKTFEEFKADRLASLPPTTRNKLYVACTRARGNLYFVSENLLKKYKNR